MKIGVLVGEVTGFKFLEEFADLFFVEEEGGDDDEGGGVCGDLFGEVEFRKGLSLEERGDGAVDEIERALRGWKQREQECEHDGPEGVVRDQRRDDGDDEQEGEGEGSEDVEVVVPATDEGAEAVDWGRVVADALGEEAEALCEEVVADVADAAGIAGIGAWSSAGVAGEVEGALRGLDFIEVCVAG